MKYNVTVYFLDGTTNRFESADRVELLSAAGGILSVIEDKTNTCFPIHFIERYVVEDVEETKNYTKADYIMALHKEYGCDFIRAEEAHQKALEYLRDLVRVKG